MMAQYYPDVNITAENPLIDLWLYGNQVTDGGLSIFTLITIFGISFLASKNWGTERAFTLASGLTSIFAWFLLIAGGLVAEYVPLVPTVLFFISLFFLD